MKKLLSILLASSFILTSSAFAYDSAKLRVKISGPIKSNKYFLCISGMGCLSILAANKGKTIPIDSTIGNIVTMNAKNMRMYPQPLPQSCDVNVQNNQTLTISGKLVEGANDKVYLTNLRCSVA